MCLNFGGGGENLEFSEFWGGDRVDGVSPIPPRIFTPHVYYGETLSTLSPPQNSENISPPYF